MSEYSVSLRVIGELSLLEQVQRTLRDLPVRLRRRGQVVGQDGQGVQPLNVLLLELAHWTDTTSAKAVAPSESEDEQLAQATATLHRLVPVLASVDRARCDADLYVSVIDELDQAGLQFPAAFVVAAGMSQLKISISILVAPDADDITPGDDRST